jgi:large subunit ribosomal protein L4
MTFPKKMRKGALSSAILAKMLGQDLMVVRGLQGPAAPKTKTMVALLENLKINRTCLLAVAEADRNLYLSARNIQDLTVQPVAELNAFDIVTRNKLVVTSEAMDRLVTAATAAAAAKAKTAAAQGPATTEAPTAAKAEATA